MMHLADSLRESSFFPMGFAIQLFVQFIHTQYLYKYHEITSNKERWISIMLQENYNRVRIKYRQEKCILAQHQQTSTIFDTASKSITLEEKFVAEIKVFPHLLIQSCWVCLISGELSQVRIPEYPVLQETV